jgi:DNA-binding CsgD family transcriptional regulator
VKPIDMARLRTCLVAAMAEGDDFAREVVRAVQRWALLYGLRPSEAEVLRLWALGERPEAVADAKGITLLTLKTHKHAILAKTGGDSMEAEVARLLREVAIARGRRVLP